MGTEAKALKLEATPDCKLETKIGFKRIDVGQEKVMGQNGKTRVYCSDEEPESEESINGHPQPKGQNIPVYINFSFPDAKHEHSGNAGETSPVSHFRVLKGVYSFNGLVADFGAEVEPFFAFFHEVGMYDAEILKPVHQRRSLYILG